MYTQAQRSPWSQLARGRLGADSAGSFWPSSFIASGHTLEWSSGANSSAIKSSIFVPLATSLGGVLPSKYRRAGRLFLKIKNNTIHTMRIEIRMYKMSLHAELVEFYFCDATLFSAGLGACHSSVVTGASFISVEIRCSLMPFSKGSLGPQAWLTLSHRHTSWRL